MVIGQMIQTERELKAKPLSDVRLRQWEKLYPGCSDQFEEIFGTRNPSVSQVSSWKDTWNTTTKYFMVIDGKQPSDIVVRPGIKEKIYQTCHEIGIHPYFWDYWIKRIACPDDPTWYITIDAEPRASFYFEEHLIMFKLAWRS